MKNDNCNISNELEQQVLNRLKSAIIIIDNSLIIQRIFSDKNADFFKVAIEGRHIFELLFPQDYPKFSSNINVPANLKIVEEALALCFENENYIFSAQQLLPQFIEISNHIISLFYSRIVLEKYDKVFIMIEAVDSTKYEILKKKSEYESIRTNIILRIAADKQSFFEFIQDANKTLIDLKLDINKPQLTVDNLRSIMRTVHTLKGNSSFFGLSNLTDAAHLMEDDLNDIIQKYSINDTSPNNELNAQLENLFSALHWNLDMISDYIPKKEILSNSIIYQIASHDLDSLLESIEDNISGMEKMSLNDIIIDLKMQPIKHIVRRFKQNAQILAAHLQKKITPVESINLNFPPDIKYLKPVLNTFTHIIRNAIDHGIELPEERISAGKPEAGKIIIDVSDHFMNGMLYYKFIFADDGAGINIERLKAAAIEKKLCSLEDIEKLKGGRIYDLLFLDSVSTKRKTTVVSGRGIGMSAVQKAVELFSGEISIKSTPGEGTTFTILIPFER